jgi:hypothetical protein
MEESLQYDPAFVAASHDLHRLYEGKPLDGDDKAAAQYGINTMASFAFKFLGDDSAVAQAYDIVRSESPQYAKAFLYAARQYDRLPMFTARGIYRAVSNIAQDPTTYAGVGTAGAGFVAKQAGVRGVKTALETLAKNRYKALAVEGGVYTGGTTLAEQEIRLAGGEQMSPEQRATELGVSTAIGAAAAPALAKGLEVAAPAAARAVGEGLRAVDRAGQRAQSRLDENVGTTLMSGIDPKRAADELTAGAGQVARAISPDVNAPTRQVEMGLGEPGDAVIAPASEQPKVLQLSPEYRVRNDAYSPQGKSAFVPKAVTPQNIGMVSQNLDTVAQEFSDPLSSSQQWVGMQSRLYNSDEVPMAPNWLIEKVNDEKGFADWFGALTPRQIQKADEGLSVQKGFEDAYAGGADEQLTGQLMLWSILSRRMSAYPHEGGYLDLAEAARPFIAKAARGEWSDADTAAWLEIVPKTIPEGSPGKSATSNANDFGKVFLSKMAEVDENGVSKLTKLHNMIADPAMTGPQIRRAFFGLAKDAGIKNKVMSFALLVSGRNDVVVLDRIQINTMWAGGDKVYDDMYHLFDNGSGLALYEGLERSLGKRVNKLYENVGRPEQASLGRYHWESWVLSSGQEVAHPTLEAVVSTGAPTKGSNASGVDFVPVREGRFHAKQFGVEYERTPTGNNFVYRTQDGTPYNFDRKKLDAMFKEAFKASRGVVPKGFKVSDFYGGDTPWYDDPRVDRDKLDKIVREYGKK